MRTRDINYCSPFRSERVDGSRADLELIRRDRGGLSVVLRDRAVHPVATSSDIVLAVGCRHLIGCLIGDLLAEVTADRLRLARGDGSTVTGSAEQRASVTWRGVSHHSDRARVVHEHVIYRGDLEQLRLRHDRRRRCRGRRRGDVAPSGDLPLDGGVDADSEVTPDLRAVRDLDARSTCSLDGDVRRGTSLDSDHCPALRGRRARHDGRCLAHLLAVLVLSGVRRSGPLLGARDGHLARVGQVVLEGDLALDAGHGRDLPGALQSPDLVVARLLEDPRAFPLLGAEGVVALPDLPATCAALPVTRLESFVPDPFAWLLLPALLDLLLGDSLDADAEQDLPLARGLYCLLGCCRSACCEARSRVDDGSNVLLAVVGRGGAGGLEACQADEHEHTDECE